MSIYDEIRAERERAHAKHGDTSMEAAPIFAERRHRILGEEYGEVLREFNDAENEGRAIDAAKLRKELVQVAAMAAAWADVIPVPMAHRHRKGKCGWCDCSYGEHFGANCPDESGHVFVQRDVAATPTEQEGQK